MKFPVPKFVFAAALVLFALSGIKGDRSSTRNVEGQKDYALLVSELQKDFHAAGNQLAQKRTDKSDKSEPSFAFPNIFDALRLIF